MNLFKSLINLFKKKNPSLQAALLTVAPEVLPVNSNEALAVEPEVVLLTPSSNKASNEINIITKTKKEHSAKNYPQVFNSLTAEEKSKYQETGFSAKEFSQKRVDFNCTSCKAVYKTRPLIRSLSSGKCQTCENVTVKSYKKPTRLLMLYSARNRKVVLLTSSKAEKTVAELKSKYKNERYSLVYLSKKLDAKQAADKIQKTVKNIPSVNKINDEDLTAYRQTQFAKIWENLKDEPNRVEDNFKNSNLSELI